MKLAQIGNKLYRITPDQIPLIDEDAYIWNVGDPIDLAFENGFRIIDLEGPYSLEFPFQLKPEYQSIPKWVMVGDWRIA